MVQSFIDEQIKKGNTPQHADTNTKNNTTMEEKLKVCEVKLTYQTKIKASERETVYSSKEAYKLFLSVFDTETIQYKESMKVILLSRARKVLGVCSISEGGIDETSADIRIILQAAILGNASAIVLAHNYPSGCLTPSRQDNKLTEQLKKASQLLNIRLDDHLIISDEGYFSYADEGKI